MGWATGMAMWSTYHDFARDKTAEAAEFHRMMPQDDPVEQPITDELDLHTFQPREISSLLPDYFAECRKMGIWRVRVIHGKGTGALREAVHSVLRRLPDVASFQLADANSGGWGATWVTLRSDLPPA